jgi:hypothetical protein
MRIHIFNLHGTLYILVCNAINYGDPVASHILSYESEFLFLILFLWTAIDSFLKLKLLCLLYLLLTLILDYFK